MKVLVIEDDPGIVEAISFAFQVGWPETRIISTSEGQKGIEYIETESPGVVILDLDLPDIDGFEVIRQIRLFSAVPILVLTVSSEERDVVKALEIGANEYVTKPFRQMELLARVNCLLRGQNVMKEEQRLFLGDLSLDPLKRKLVLCGREIDLTCTECLILRQLMRLAPSVATYSTLIDEVWGEDYPGAMDSLKVHIRHLRSKIEKNPSKPQIIQTRIGIGYMLAKPS